MTLAAMTEAPAAVMSVYDCIVAVSRDMAQQGISKTRSNAQQGYKFRGIDDVLNALSPLLAKYRLVILPRILSRTVVEHASKSGGVLFYVTVEAEFDFVSAADGSKHTVKTYGEAMDSADKATNKAMSAAYKYAAFQTFCIPTEGDNDADAVTHEPVIQIQRQTPPAANIPQAPGRLDGVSASSVTTVRTVTMNHGKTTTGRDYDLYVVKFEDGREASTFSADIALAAESARDAKLPVDPVLTPAKRAGKFDLMALNVPEPVL